jgi:hypothetical protein
MKFCRVTFCCEYFQSCNAVIFECMCHLNVMLFLSISMNSLTILLKEEFSEYVTYYYLCH